MIKPFITVFVVLMCQSFVLYKPGNCQPGTYIYEDRCVPCAQGTYQEQPWQTSCDSCETDRDTMGPGANNRTMCLCE